MIMHKTHCGPTRRRRSLPSCLHKRGNIQFHTFWPTFRGALDWVRKRQEDLNTAVGLLEIYPNLIQDSCFDGFWEYIRPLLNDMEASDSLQLTKDSKRPSLNREHVDIPVISVTNDAASDPGSGKSVEHGKERRLVYICFPSHKYERSANLNRIVFDVCSRCYVRTSPPHSNFQEAQTAIIESDAFMFFITLQTLTDRFCLYQLKIALTLMIPVIFMREPEFRITAEITDIMITLDNSLEDLVPRNSLSSHLTPISLMRSKSPVSDMFDERMKSWNISRARSTSAAKQERKDKHSTVEKDNVNVQMAILLGYQEAILYDREFHSTSVEMLCERLREKLGNADMTRIHRRDKHSGSSGSESDMSFVNPDDHLTSGSYYKDDDDIDHTGSSTKLTIPKAHFDAGSGEGMDSGINSPVDKETFYLVFPKSEPGVVSPHPKVVKWPQDSLDGDDDLDNEVFSASSLSFYDVDLTLEVNGDSTSSVNLSPV